MGRLKAEALQSGETSPAEVRRGSREISQMTGTQPVVGGGTHEKECQHPLRAKIGPPRTASKEGGAPGLQLRRTELGDYPNDLGNDSFPELPDQSLSLTDTLTLPL